MQLGVRVETGRLDLNRGVLDPEARPEHEREGVEQARDRTHGSSCIRACVHMYTHARFRCLAVSDETLYLMCIFVVVVIARVTPGF